MIIQFPRTIRLKALEEESQKRVAPLASLYTKE